MPTHADAPKATPASSLEVRVREHKKSVEEALTALGPAERSRRDIEEALSQVQGLLTGDLDNIPHVVAAELSRWLEATKYVDDRVRKS
jgi:hypothetical protein